ncbi:hypothetical protein V7799_28430 [Rhizobium laguerreae]
MPEGHVEAHLFAEQSQLVGRRHVAERRNRRVARQDAHGNEDQRQHQQYRRDGISQPEQQVSGHVELSSVSAAIGGVISFSPRLLLQAVDVER